MALDIETMFNTVGVKRFAFPGRIVWGCGVRAELLDLVACGSADLIVDARFVTHPFVAELQNRLGPRLRCLHSLAGPPGSGAVQCLADRLEGPADLLIALGGGATIDFAKAILAHWLYGSIDGVGLAGRRGEAPQAGGRRPTFFALPTTAGSGAEASRYYVTYDENSRVKVHGKSWRLVADWIFLDPHFLASAPPSLILHGAFDAFVHYLESLLCRGERSWFGEMLSVAGIARIMGALVRLESAAQAERESIHLELLYAATLAGMAISNVRTGHIHEAGGALLEHTTLAHAETLLVFLAEACAGYAPVEDARLAPLWHALSTLPGMTSPRGLVALAAWWESCFAGAGAIDPIVSEVARIADDGRVMAAIVARVKADRVWVEKESPIPLGDTDIERFVERSLATYSTRSGGS